MNKEWLWIKSEEEEEGEGELTWCGGGLVVEDDVRLAVAEVEFMVDGKEGRTRKKICRRERGTSGSS